MRDLKIELSGKSVLLFVLLAVVSLSGIALAAVAGTASRWNPSGTLDFQGSSGNDAFAFKTNGLRAHFGAGASDYASSDGTTVTFAGALATSSTMNVGSALTFNSGSTAAGSTGATGSGNTLSTYIQSIANATMTLYGNKTDGSGAVAVSSDNLNTLATTGAKIHSFRNNGSEKASISYDGYFASATPFTLASVYVNNTIAAFTYGGMKLPARAFTVTNVGYNIRVVGSGGSTNNTFQISDGTNTCTCTFACNQTAGSQIASCSNGAGTGCVYAASAALTFGFSAVGNCTTATDILGNMEVIGNWQ